MFRCALVEEEDEEGEEEVVEEGRLLEVVGEEEVLEEEEEEVNQITIRQQLQLERTESPSRCRLTDLRLIGWWRGWDGLRTFPLADL
jgi:hypothetical protein